MVKNSARIFIKNQRRKLSISLHVILIIVFPMIAVNDISLRGEVLMPYFAGISVAWIILIISFILLKRGLVNDLAGVVLHVVSNTFFWIAMFSGLLAENTLNFMSSISYIFSIIIIAPFLLGRKLLRFFYMINAVVLSAYFYSAIQIMPLSRATIIDYMIDNIIAIFLATYVMRFIYNISNGALVRATKEIKRNKKLNKELSDTLMSQKREIIEAKRLEVLCEVSNGLLPIAENINGLGGDIYEIAIRNIANCQQKCDGAPPALESKGLLEKYNQDMYEALAELKKNINAMISCSLPFSSEKDTVDIMVLLEYAIFLSKINWAIPVEVNVKNKDEELRAACFPSCVQQILVILLNKAEASIRKRKITVHQNFVPEIIVDCRRDVHELAVTIVDNGVCIAPEIVAKMNKMDFGEDLNYQIVGNVVARHDGSVFVESSNEGTVFSIFLKV